VYDEGPLAEMSAVSALVLGGPPLGVQFATDQLPDSGEAQEYAVMP
jgi:hypothetical protein